MPLAVALCAALLLPAGAARAHVRLVSPVSRYGDEMKFGPCGRLAGARTTRVTTLRPGQEVTVVFDETIDHPGSYRVAFDAAGDDDLAPPVWSGTAWENPPQVLLLADGIGDAALTHGEVVVRLPDVECDACTLQLMQIMTDKPPFDGGDDFYFQCADLVLSRTAPVGGPPPPSSPAMPGGGCASAPGGEGTGMLLAVAATLWSWRRLRRGRAPG